MAEITRELLLERRKGYYEAFLESLSQTNANHGAMDAIDQLLVELDKSADPVTPKVTPDNETDSEEADAAA